VGGKGSNRSTTPSSTQNLDETRLLLSHSRAGSSTATSIDPATAAAAYGGWGMPTLTNWADEIDNDVPTYGTQGKFTAYYFLFYTNNFDK
jgi:hypothetical protein